MILFFSAVFFLLFFFEKHDHKKTCKILIKNVNVYIGIIVFYLLNNICYALLTAEWIAKAINLIQTLERC